MSEKNVYASIFPTFSNFLEANLVTLLSQLVDFLLLKLVLP